MTAEFHLHCCVDVKIRAFISKQKQNQTKKNPPQPSLKPRQGLSILLSIDNSIQMEQK